MPLSAPQAAGDQLNPVDIENHTMVVIPVKFHEHAPTVHTKAGETSPAIESYVVDFSTPASIPTVYRGVMWWNVMLVNGLKRQLGETVLGRMVKGQQTTAGKNAPWQLLDVMSEQSWVDYAEAWLATEEGKAFEAEAQRQLDKAPQVAATASTPAAAPPPAAPAGPPPAPVAAPPASAPPAAPPAAPAPVAAPAPAAAVADPMAILAAMPEEERAKYLAILGNQGQAAH